MGFFWESPKQHYVGMDLVYILPFLLDMTTVRFEPCGSNRTVTVEPEPEHKVLVPVRNRIGTVTVAVPIPVLILKEPEPPI